MSSQGEEDQVIPTPRGGLPSIGRAKLARPTTYEVGYGKPPEAHRFQQGRSGNPSGRPKGAKNKPKLLSLYEERLQEIVLEEAFRTVPVRDGDRTINVPMATAVVRSIAVNAAKGHHRSQRHLTELLARVEAAKRHQSEEYFQALLTHKAEWERELWRRKQLGITHLPDPLPHPDHIIIDVRAGTADVRGPITKEEKAEWDRVAQQKEVLGEAFETLLERLKRTRSPAKRRALQEQIQVIAEALASLREDNPD